MDAARSSVLAFRLGLLWVAAAGVAAAAILSRRADEAAAGLAAGVTYACPMHPEVTAAGASDCPICGMRLVPSRGANEGEPRAGVAPAVTEITAARRRLVTGALVASAVTLEDGDVAAYVYNEDLGTLTADETATFAPASSPDAGSRAVRRAPDAPVAWDGSTSRVRFRADARAGAWRPGAVGRLRFAERPRELLMIPVTALLASREGPYVLAAAVDGSSYAKRPIEIGKVAAGFAVVVSGLRDEELIVARDAFFLDAERRLRHDPDTWQP